MVVVLVELFRAAGLLVDSAEQPPAAKLATSREIFKIVFIG